MNFEIHQLSNYASRPTSTTVVARVISDLPGAAVSDHVLATATRYDTTGPELFAEVRQLLFAIGALDTPYAPEDDSLEAIKARKWAELKRDRNAQEFGPFNWGGKTFDGDEAAQRRISWAVLGAQQALASEAPFSVEWTLADNGVITLSAGEVISLATALGENTRLVHAWARELRELLAAATEVDQVEAILWVPTPATP